MGERAEKEAGAGATRDAKKIDHATNGHVQLRGKNKAKFYALFLLFKNGCCREVVILRAVLQTIGKFWQYYYEFYLVTYQISFRHEDRGMPFAHVGLGMGNGQA